MWRESRPKSLPSVPSSVLGRMNHPGQKVRRPVAEGAGDDAGARGRVQRADPCGKRVKALGAGFKNQDHLVLRSGPLPPTDIVSPNKNPTCLVEALRNGLSKDEGCPLLLARRDSLSPQEERERGLGPQVLSNHLGWFSLKPPALLGCQGLTQAPLYPSAWARSALRSSMSSMPTARRTRPGTNPAASR